MGTMFFLKWKKEERKILVILSFVWYAMAMITLTINKPWLLW